MRKNKKVTYLLISLVGLIWGLLFYKIYSNFGEKRIAKKIISQPSTKVEEITKDSTYTLSLNYPDPFLKGIRQSDISAKNPVKAIIINWPPIEFRGLLAGKTKKENTGLLKIQNSNLLAKCGMVYSEIKVLEITKDSIFLMYHDEKRWVKMEK